MATQSPGIWLSSSSITIYGGVSTTTYAITITASGVLPLASIPMVSWPSTNIVESFEYSSIADPTIPTSAYYLTSLPTFIVTQVKIVVMNTAGQPITSLYEFQAQPAYLYSTSSISDTRTDCIGNSYTCWSPSKIAVIVIAATLGGLVVIILVTRLCCMRLRRFRNVDEESSYATARRDRNQDFDSPSSEYRQRAKNLQPTSAGQRRRQRVKRTHDSLLSEYHIEPPQPLPCVVIAPDYPEAIKMTRLTQKALTETSTALTGQRAMVGCGMHDTRRNTVYFDDTESPKFGGERHATKNMPRVKDFGEAPLPRSKTLSRLRLALDFPEIENFRSSRTEGWVTQQERGRNRTCQSLTRRPPSSLESCSPYRESDSPPTDSRISFAPYAPLVVAVLEDNGKS